MFTSTRISQCVTSRFAPNQALDDSLVLHLSIPFGNEKRERVLDASRKCDLRKKRNTSARCFSISIRQRCGMVSKISHVTVHVKLVDLSSNAQKPTIVPFPGLTSYNSSRGQFGVFEGFTSDVQAVNGTNPQSINVRDDCTTETAMAFATRCRILNKSEDCDVTRIFCRLLGNTRVCSKHSIHRTEHQRIRSDS